MGKSSKKGRLTGTQRKEINDRTVSSVMDEETEGIVFGRVLKHLGAGHVRVILPNKSEGIAKIRTVLSRRGSTPIVSDDIVVLSGRDFETKTTADGKAVDRVDRYDLLGVLTRSQAAKMEKEGRIPAWFVLSAEEAADGEGDIFDYSEIPEVDETEEIDIDAI